jgi:hypothetical protein
LPSGSRIGLRNGPFKQTGWASKRILIAEDECIVAEQLQQSLASHGYEVIIEGPDGKLSGFAKVMRDETERRRTSDQLTSSLAENEALLKEFTTG